MTKPNDEIDDDVVNAISYDHIYSKESLFGIGDLCIDLISCSSDSANSFLWSYFASVLLGCPNLAIDGTIDKRQCH